MMRFIHFTDSLFYSISFFPHINRINSNELFHIFMNVLLSIFHASGQQQRRKNATNNETKNETASYLCRSGIHYAIQQINNIILRTIILSMWIDIGIA